MTDALIRFLRAIPVIVLGLIGMLMALVFMASTAIALGILYVVAKVRGKPFGVRAYWSQRQSGRPFQGQSPFAAAPARGADVIDVEAREVR
ncbi:hypothetical protein [Bordetella pseudohinzii]|uniref:N-acetyltransferase YedL n=1 Tax=Bordetella pseudohinzii TaxID=1331258 RepID=A0A0J6C149_9BORD|nr:hypothetical protein [Bordetella pseudohinzii]ANY17677.1 hypothetical protein BBN53_18375 [Bordetella pseudohinzii]KMM24753.1 hypothetical protein L540_04320 [Bordetella pseudohinzii]KXA76064.1 hypothetical protein AW877_17850 [Bordetella pseudohinzii]KXA77238.1 hypothetical protein AW878_16060 [Bordetella pseudohinzii]CUJ01398.1 Uncharacterised protein [Bordetella pseudohinzii]